MSSTTINDILYRMHEMQREVDIMEGRIHVMLPDRSNSLVIDVHGSNSEFYTKLGVVYKRIHTFCIGYSYSCSKRRNMHSFVFSNAWNASSALPIIQGEFNSARIRKVGREELDKIHWIKHS